MTRIDWRDGKGPIGEFLPWQKAVIAADQGDVAPLAELLRSAHPLHEYAREYLADLVERKLTARVGRPKRPIYRVADTEEAAVAKQTMMQMKKLFRAFRKAKLRDAEKKLLSRDEVIDLVLREFKREELEARREIAKNRGEDISSYKEVYLDSDIDAKVSPEERERFFDYLRR